MKWCKSNFWQNQKQASDSGMSLVEILIVLTLLVSMLALFATNLFKNRDDAMVDEARIAMGLIANDLAKFRVTNFKYPENLQDLVTDPGNYKNWRGPYIDEKRLSDVWDNEYNYERISSKEFKITSAGLDGEMDTDDDIHYPEQKEPDNGGDGGE